MTAEFFTEEKLCKSYVVFHELYTVEFFVIYFHVPASSESPTT